MPTRKISQPARGAVDTARMQRKTRFRSGGRGRRTAYALALIAGLAPTIGRAQFAPGSQHTTVGPGAGLEGAVSPTGGYSASVPLDLPSPRGGLPVPVAVQYTGVARAGAAGVGWDVPLSFVAWQRDEHSKPKADENDGSRPRRLWLSLGGSATRMVATDATETRFVPLVAGEYQELVRDGNDWVLRTLSNLEYRFAPNSAEGSWLLASIIDRTGTDRVTLEYNAVGVGTCAPDTVLTKVSYGYSAAGVPLYEIELGYEGWWRPAGEIGASRTCATRPSQLAASGQDQQVIFDHSADRMVPTERTSMLTSVRVKARNNLAPSAAPRVLRSYQLTYQPDLDTAKPRLTTVTQAGLDGVGSLPVATYRYEAMTHTLGEPSLQLRQPITVPRSIALPAKYRDDMGESADTVEETAEPAPGFGDSIRRREVSRLRHTIRDLTGDGIPDEVWKDGDTWYLARGIMTASGPRLDAGWTTWTYPSELSRRDVVRPLDGLVEDQAHDEHNRGVVTETWSQLIDWNGDGRLDVIDAKGGSDADHWKVWINEVAPGGSGAIAWRETQVAVSAFTQFRHQQGLDELDLVDSHRTPVARARTWPRSIQRSCRVPGFYLGEYGHWDCPGRHGIPSTYIPALQGSDTWTEWELVDVNRDGYPDLLGEAKPIAVCDDNEPDPYDYPYAAGYTYTGEAVQTHHAEYLDYTPCAGEGGVTSTSPFDKAVFLNHLGAFNDLTQDIRWTDPLNTSVATTQWVSGADEGRDMWSPGDFQQGNRQELQSWLAREPSDVFQRGAMTSWSVDSWTSGGITPMYFSNVKACDDQATTYEDSHRSGFLDVNNDGLVDRVSSARKQNVAFNSGTGFGTGLGTARWLDGSLSNAVGDCGEEAGEASGWIDLDGDGVPDRVSVTNSVMSFASLLTGSGAPAFTAGRLVAIENGYGAVTKIRYANAKIDRVTRHAVPFPEIVVSDVTTEVVDGSGPSLATVYYRYGDAAYEYDGMSASWSFPGYQKTLTLTGLPDDRARVRGIVTLTQRGPAFAPGAGFVDKVKAHRVQSVSYVEGSFDPDALHDYFAPGAATAFAETRYEYTARTAAYGSASTFVPYDCGEMLQGYWTQGQDDCRATGYVHTTAQRSWEGTPLPSLDNAYTGSSVTAIDSWGRVTASRADGDLRRADDDVCTLLTYGNGAPFPSVVTSVTVTDCGVEGQAPRVLGRSRLLYDNLPFGMGGVGRVTSRQVDRFDAAGNPLGGFETERFAYSALGQIAQITADRTTGAAATRVTTLTRDAFGASVTNVSEVASDVGITLTQKFKASVWPDVPATATATSGVITTVYADGFGRSLRTETKAGGRTWTSERVTYDDSPTARRVIVETFPDSDDQAADASRSTTVFDALMRVRYTQTELGADYAQGTIVSGVVERDGLNRVVFAAAPFEYGAQPFVADAVARHGTTYVYDGRGKVVRTVEAMGRNEQALVTDVAAKVYVASQSYRYSNGYIELAAQGPDELDPTSARFGHRDEQTLTAIGREVRRLRRDAALEPRDRIEQVFDRLGRLTVTRRYADPLSAVAAVEWTTEYDSLGNVVRMTEPGIARSMSYDEFGGLLATSWTDGGAVRSVRSAFDGFGRLTEVQRVTSTSGVDQVESVEKYHYDLAAAGTAQPPMAAALLQGRLSWIESDVGTVSFGYDAQGRESGTYYEYRDVPGVIAEEATLTLGGQLRDLWLTTPWSADKVAYGYDTAGRMRTVSRDGEALAEASANEVGQYQAVKYGNGARDFFEYAPSGRRELMSWKTETPAAAYNHEYLARDAAGRVVERREDNDGRVTRVASAYDTMGRLSAQMRDGGGPDLEMFVYDGLGNMRSRTTAAGALWATMLPSDADRLCRFAAVGTTGPCQATYDGAGNVKEDSTSGAVRTFTYDAGQRVTRMTRNGVVAEVTHGPLGRAKLVVTGGPQPRTVWSFGDRIEYRVRTDKVAQVDRRIPGPLGELVSLRTELDRDGNVAAEQAVYQHGDSQANRVFTDRDGQVVQAATFDVFGGVTDGHDDGTLTGSDDLWNGGDDLPELGVTLLGPRVYDSTLGRFLQRDPIAVMTSSSRANPYAFAFSDPENYSDPSGLCPAETQCLPLPWIDVPFGEPGMAGGGGGRAPAPQISTGYADVMATHVSLADSAASRLGWGCFGAPCDAVLARSRASVEFARAYPDTWSSSAFEVYDALTSGPWNPVRYFPRLKDGQQEQPPKKGYLFPHDGPRLDIDSLPRGTPGSTLPPSVSLSGTTAPDGAVGTKLALGIARRLPEGSTQLNRFAERIGAKTYGQLAGTWWPGSYAALQEGLLREMNAASSIHFDLEGFDVDRFTEFIGNPSIGPRNATNWELYTILNNPSLLGKTTFYGGSPPQL